MPLRAHARAHGVTLADVARRRPCERAELVVSAVTASQTVAAAEACARALPDGSFFLDFNSASPGAKIAAAEHVDARRRPLRRRRGDDLGAALTASRCRCCSAARTPRRCAGAGRSRLRRPGGERQARRRQRHQDVPQRDDQGPRGDGDRELHGRPALRRRGRGDRVAARDLSRHRLGEAGRLLLPARHRAWPPPRRGDARGGGHRARGRPRAVERGRHRRAPGLGGRPRRRGRVRRAAPTHELRAAAPTGASRPTGSSTTSRRRRRG